MQHKKENKPVLANEMSKNKIRCDKHHDKKKRKKDLMRHHSKNSEAMEGLATASAETLKDINKWLDTPKISESIVVPSGEYLSRDRDFDVRNGLDIKKRKKPGKEIPAHHGKERKRSMFDDEKEEEYSPPPSKMARMLESKKSDMVKKKKKKSYQEDTSSESESRRNKSPSKKGKHHHHHRHHHHSHSDAKLSGDKSEKRNDAAAKLLAIKRSVQQSKNRGAAEKDHYTFTDDGFDNPHAGRGRKDEGKSSGKSLEEKKLRGPAKRGSSNKTIKKLQSGKSSKPFSFSLDSKYKSSGATNDFHSHSNSVSGKSTDHHAGSHEGHSNNGIGEKAEKKKCLLLSDASSVGENGPKLSLGSVLPSDSIKLGDFKNKDDVFTDDEDDSKSPTRDRNASSDQDTKDSKTVSKHGAHTPIGGKSGEARDSNLSEEQDKEQESDNDRKLEPSKGFQKEKCMPNLSAWIKAFGGPAKGASTSVSSTPKKVDAESKNKFKVMGRGVSTALGSDAQKHHPQGLIVSTASKSPIVKSGPKTPVESLHQSKMNLLPLGSSSMKSDGSQGPPSPSQHPLAPSEDPEREHKRHRHRKMSTSSLSSQSESGSPICYANHDGSSPAAGHSSGLVNPPRWVDELWVSHSQSQSPSASSQVSSQSPAGPNSPFSPPISSPPQTPQTPPRPTAPVRVGFYQDLTSQHSSPEKLNENHSNPNSVVASPSTPPTPTSAHITSSSNGSSTNQNNNSATGNNRRESCSNSSASGPKNGSYGQYSVPVYPHGHSSNTPSPKVAPNSNSSSVSSPGNPSSPHSPSITTDYHSTKGGKNKSVSSPQNPPTSPYPLGLTNYNNSSHNQGSGSSSSGSPHPETGSHPPLSLVQQQYNGPLSYQHPSMSHSRPSGYLHTTSSGNSAAYVHHHQSAQMPAAAHRQSNPSSSSLPPNIVNHGNSQPQPQPFPSNPYASNPRNINVAPTVYSGESISRDYRTSHDSGLPISSTPASLCTTNVSSRSSRSSRNNPTSVESETARMAAKISEAKLGMGGPDLNGFQWPHNLASLSQIVNSIPTPIGVSMANAYRSQFDQSTVENMNKYQRPDSAGYAGLNSSPIGMPSAVSGSSFSGKSSSNHGEKGEGSSTPTPSGKSKSSKSSESKSSSR